MALQREISSNLSECRGALWTSLVADPVFLDDQNLERSGIIYAISLLPIVFILSFNDMERINHPTLLTCVLLTLMQQVAMDEYQRARLHLTQIIDLFLDLLILFETFRPLATLIRSERHPCAFLIPHEPISNRPPTHTKSRRLKMIMDCSTRGSLKPRSRAMFAFCELMLDLLNRGERWLPWLSKASSSKKNRTLSPEVKKSASWGAPQVGNRVASYGIRPEALSPRCALERPLERLAEAGGGESIGTSVLPAYIRRAVDGHVFLTDDCEITSE
ncbi:hypothetical protein KC362_g9 [Hortaea werneckii]|nr:hypothetical protein KC362_g9 [Hortaea werneckii]